MRVAIHNVQSPGEEATESSLDDAALWSRWREQRDPIAREQLLEIHMPYARIVAASYYAKRFHDDIEFGDYLQYASVGLLEAFDRYDPSKGAQFRTFAARRMHGAILNGLERFTEKQQQIAVRQRLRSDRVAAIKEMASELTTPGKSSAGGGRTSAQLAAYVAEVGFGLALAWLLEGTAMVGDDSKNESIPFYRSTEIRQLKERIVSAVEGLPPQQRQVIKSHYLQEIPFEEIATFMGLTKGRISQIHKAALAQLKQILQAGESSVLA